MGHGHYIAPPRGQYQVGEGQKLDLQFVTLPGESHDLDITIDLTGPGAEVNLRGLYICDGSDKVRFRVVMHHMAPGCVSRQNFRGIVLGDADVRFEGTIIVAPEAQQTDATQENHSILLSTGARAESQPQLEIYADDVKCSHGSTVGRLDEDARFYMRSRGIPEQEARTLQILSFLSGVTPEDRAEEIENAVRSL